MRLIDISSEQTFFAGSWPLTKCRRANASFHPYKKYTRVSPACILEILRRTSGFCSCCRGRRSACSGLSIRSCRSRSATGFVERVDDLVCEINVVWRVQHDRDAVYADPGFIENKIKALGLHFLHYDIRNFLYDSLPHSHQLLLQLSLPRLAKIADLSFHAFNVCDLVIALFGHPCLLVGAQSWRLELLVEVIDFI